MPGGEVVGALHFHQAADGAFKFECTVAGLIESFWFCRCGREQLDLVFIKRVDQRNEPCGFVTTVRPHLRNADDNHGVLMIQLDDPRAAEIMAKNAARDAANTAALEAATTE